MVDWHALFGLPAHPLEIVLRGSAMYWFLFVIFRFVLRRGTGSIGIADILLLVLVADASQNAMAGDYRTVPEGMLLVSVLCGWNWLLDWAALHAEPIRRFIEPPAVVVVRHGRLMHRAMRRELIGREELMSKLRENGIETVAQVKMARVEPNGEISVVKEDDTR